MAEPYYLPDTHEVEITATFKDAHGHPTKPASPVAWASSDENIATIAAVSDDTTKATVRSNNELGTTQISATYTIDGTEKVKTGDIQTVPSDPTEVGFEFGESVPIPPHVQPV